MKANVYIQGPAYYGSTASVFREYGYNIVRDIGESDMVVLTGGEDINPAIYGEKPHKTTYWDTGRDKVDLRAVDAGLNQHKFLVGICRGAQLLNCFPNDGKLIQDVDGHESGYHMTMDFIDGEVRKVISVHHQQMIPTPKAVLVAAANVNSPEGEWSDTEVLWYPHTRSFCFQGHPEFGHEESSRYFFHLLDRYYHGNV